LGRFTIVLGKKKIKSTIAKLNCKVKNDNFSSDHIT